MASTSPLSIEDCRATIASMLMSEADAQARVELVQAGVASHRVDSLYPATFSYFVQQICDLFQVHGTGYLCDSDANPAHWFKYRNRVSRMRNQLPKALAISYEVEFLGQWKAGMARQMVDAVYERLLPVRGVLVANTDAGSYGYVIFGAYWFAHHAELAAEQQGEWDGLVLEVGSNLLPTLKV